ncbi:7-cyano-7-deazaguanine synthase QueC [Candidatus Avelusimicrobium gallicola]|uniref:7-cyano-7-deazaguanine synthase n=1 Tax=Candidatus Avelusimicrobium gallicola TaxID=2562704 RepID=A0A1Y4DB96_9BACT|nr:7-cyano-7-deazaguanine synthase QueC [Elusimicrobium sp. An273]OUO56125.1 7-cyano-7-deazaguanine synthase QueC [Elusimicrobium sp. An273]
MNVLIARTIEECEQWTDVAVVVDVLCASTTVCALLKRGKKDVLAFGDAAQAAAFVQAHGDFEVYSDVDFALPHENNSPSLAAKSNARKPALVLTSAGTKALEHLKQASLVLMGGFCNFYALAEALAAQPKDILLVSGSLFDMADDVEDGLCVSALKDYIQGIGNPQDAIVEFNNTMRFGEFLHSGSKTAEKDLKTAFKVNGIAVVPQVSFAPDGYGVCHVFGQPAPQEWMGKQPSSAAPEPAPQAAAPAEETPAPATVPQQPAPVQESTPAADTLQTPAAENTLRKEVKTAEKNLQAAAQQATTRLKGFFSGILKAVKEEKAELEGDLGMAQKQAESPKTAPQNQFEDPLDRVLKKSERAPAPQENHPARPAEPEAPAAPEQEAAPQPSPVQAAVPAGEVTFSREAAAGLSNKKRKKAIVLFSGGLDSTTCLYWALAHGYECEALTVSYGQRHEREVQSAQAIARKLGIKHHLITLDLPWLSCCSLVDKNKQLPDIAVEDIPKEGIPSTYVPGRNLMFLAIAGSLLDAVGADAIIAGPNAVDFSGYPDCTPAFFKAAAEALNRGTKTGVSEGIEVLAPLMRLSKAQIVKLAANLKVPFELTWSCYAGGKKPCGHCDSCKLRAKGFEEAGVHDTSLD